MTSEVWALAGVIVGALLGAGAQILADRLRHQREQSDREAQTRLAAYARLLEAGDDLISAIREDVILRDVRDGRPQEDDIALEPTEAAALIDQATSVSRARQLVQLHGSQVAIDAATQLEHDVERLLGLLRGGGRFNPVFVTAWHRDIIASWQNLLSVARREGHIED